MGACGFEQVEGPDDVGVDEVGGGVDRAIHVALGGEMHHGARPVLLEDTLDRVAVANVGADEAIPRVAVQRGEVEGVAGVSQLVEVHDRLAGVGQPVQDEIRADEAGAAGDEDHRDKDTAARVAERG